VTWEKRLTKALKRYDPQLYARRVDTLKRDKSGEFMSQTQMHVFRKSARYEVMSFEDGHILYSRPQGQFVFALTDNWVSKGDPRPWGIEPVMARLKALDLWNRGVDIFDEIEKEDEKDEESSKRDLKNNTESFLYDFASEFRKATGQINTSNLKNIKENI